MELLLVELHALLVRDLALGALPDGDLGVYRLALDLGDGLVLGASVLVGLAGLLHLGPLYIHLDGPADVVGVFFHQAHDLPALQVVPVALVVIVRLEVHDDIGAGAVLLALCDGVAVRAGALPPVRGVRAVGPGDDRHLVGDHERAVEANAELADYVGGVLGVIRAGYLFLEGHGTALGDYAEVALQLGLGHADAVVADGEGARIVVHGDEDAEVLPVHADAVVGQRAVGKLVYGVRGVGDDLAQEDFLVRVDGVDHQVEQTLALGLELFLGHLYSSNVMIYDTKGQ